jgi:nucleoid-associated protein YgaU
MPSRPITAEETAHVDELVSRGRAALTDFQGATQDQVDRLCRAIGWAVANEATMTRLARMGVEESGIGDPVTRIDKRFKVMGILRDVLRQKSVGVIEELPERGIVKYAKPVGLIASLVPTTNPELTPPGLACSPSSAVTPSSFRRIRDPRTRPARRSRSCAASSSAKARPSISSNALPGPASRRLST